MLDYRELLLVLSQYILLGQQHQQAPFRFHCYQHSRFINEGLGSHCPMIRSCDGINSLILYSLLIIVFTFAGIISSRYRSRFKLTSITVTSAPRLPFCCFGAYNTAPRQEQLANPGNAPRSTPRPPKVFSRYLAPSCFDILPATSDIGINKGKTGHI